jgi:hypothetical protein
VLWLPVGALPLIGLFSLLFRSQLDPSWEGPKVQFVVFAGVRGLASMLACGAGEAANRRGGTRVLLISLAFLTMGGFLGLHAIGTPGILFSSDLSGFKIAIPLGLLVAAVFALGSAFVDWHPAVAPNVMRRRAMLRRSAFVAVALWSIGTVAKLPAPWQAGRRGRHRRSARCDRAPRRDHLRVRRLTLLGRLSRSDETPACERDRVLPASLRRNDRSPGDRRAQLARQLVAMARTDRRGIPDDRCCRPPPVAR